MSEITSKKRKLSLPLVLAGGVSSLVLALGMSPTFSAFTAQITNSANTAAAGTLIMQETDGTNICNSNDALPVGNTLGSNNAATCASINKYGGSSLMVPGTPVLSTVTITNTGTITPASFTLAGGACTATSAAVNGGANDICSKMTIKVYAGTLTADDLATATPLATGAASDWASKSLSLTPLAPATPTKYTFAVTLDGTTNAYQGLGISQPLVWKFQA